MLRVVKESGAPVVLCDYCNRPIKDADAAFYGYRPGFGAGDRNEKTTGVVPHLHKSNCAGHYARTHKPADQWRYRPLTELFDGLAALTH